MSRISQIHKIQANLVLCALAYIKSLIKFWYLLCLPYGEEWGWGGFIRAQGRPEIQLWELEQT